MRPAARRVFVAVAAIVSLLPAALRAADRPPNVIFFLVDDLGWRDLGCFGSSFYDTPHVDGLARSGMRFTNAYAACPVCSPTRASILTGRYPSRTGITDYINAAGGNQPRKWRRNTKLMPAAYKERMAHEEVTLAEALKGAGYATFFAGKWHLGPEGFWPESQGFDVNRGGITRGGPYGGFLGSQYDPLFSICDPKFGREPTQKDYYPVMPIGYPKMPALASLPSMTADRLDQRKSIPDPLDRQLEPVRTSTAV